MTRAPAGPRPGADGSDGLVAPVSALRGKPLRSRPRVTVSYAQSLDGSIAARPGEPLRLSGSRALELTHRLRAAHDAILVGIGTVLADDPQLNVRLTEGKNPRPVILDSRLRLPLTARLLRSGRAPEAAGPLLASVRGAPRERAARLREHGATVVAFRSAEGRVPLRALMRALRRRGIERLLVEGGGRVLTALFAEHLADWVVITVAPRLVGGEPALARVPAPVDLSHLTWARLDDDLVFAGRPRFAARRTRRAP